MILSNSKILWIMQIIIKLTCSISLSSNNFLYSFFTYIKMSKDSSANYYENNKERLQKKSLKQRKRERATIWLWTIQKSNTRWKKKLLEYRKKYYKMRKNALF